MMIQAMKSWRGFLLLGVAGGTLALVQACTIDDPCGEGYTLDRNYCRLDTGSGGEGGGQAGTGGDESQGGSAGESSGGEGEFGRVCTADDQCDDPAPDCAIAPKGIGDSDGITGQCSILGCATEGVVCPSGWHCFDFSDVCYPD